MKSLLFLLNPILILLSFNLGPIASYAAEAPTTLELNVQSKYEIEKQDPYHRHALTLEPALILWVNEGKDTISDFWFFLELHQADLEPRFPKIYDPYYRMVWMDDAQRAEHEAFFQMDENNSVVIDIPKTGRLTDGKWMFVLMEGSFFTAQEIKHSLHHVSLSAGKPVESAGVFNIKNGHLATIAFSSGHYRPEFPHAVQAINKLLSLNLDLSGIVVSFSVTEMGKRIRKKIPFEEFLPLICPLIDK